jgi:hypothetical protein
MNDYDLALSAVKFKTSITRGWECVDGPITGVGNEFYFRSKTAGTYYVCVDQGEVISCESEVN